MTTSRPSSRRSLLTRGAGAGALAIAGFDGLTTDASAAPASSGRSAGPAKEILLVGANPGLVLYDQGKVTAYAATWQVDWSRHGSGNAIVLWHEETVYVHGSNVELAVWLEREFVRHFPEADGLTWPEPVVRQVPVHVDIDLARGMRAHAAGLSVELADVLDRRAFRTDEFGLDGVDHSLALVLGPCARGTIDLQGSKLPGAPRRSGTPDRPGSTAYVAVAEVWER